MTSERPREARVLVVDDAEQNRHLVEIVLTSEGYNVDAAATGADALRQAAENRPDVVVLDLALPDMNGSEVMERLLQQGLASPVLIVTGDVSVKSRATTQQAAAYLMKPFDIEALLAGVAQLAHPPL